MSPDHWTSREMQPDETQGQRWARQIRVMTDAELEAEIAQAEATVKAKGGQTVQPESWLYLLLVAQRDRKSGGDPE